jgi:hypothetical protein
MGPRLHGGASAIGKISPSSQRTSDRSTATLARAADWVIDCPKIASRASLVSRMESFEDEEFAQDQNAGANSSR